jgi:hypothetical protein
MDTIELLISYIKFNIDKIGYVIISYALVKFLLKDKYILKKFKDILCQNSLKIDEFNGINFTIKKDDD